MTMFQSLGRALRWLREERRLRQYQVADAAGITKAMLSSYETGRQKPSLETLEKLLVALGCDLVELAQALAVFRGGGTPPLGAAVAVPPVPSTRGPDVRAVLGIDVPLEREEEQALGQLLGGFHRWVRHLHGQTRPERVDGPGHGNGVP
jgi:transcriptional regulator with XRE-family HTH domain